MARGGPVGLLLLATLFACTSRPSDSALSQQREQALALDKELVDKHRRGLGHDQGLVIGGQTAGGQDVSLAWSDVERLAVDRVDTVSPFHNEAKTLEKFRGVSLKRLLDKYGVQPGAAEVTFVSHDAFRSPVTIEDARQYPIILAIERNGAPMRFSEGGPVYLTFPISEHEELNGKYKDWSFYVTHMIVGEESLSLAVGDETLERTAMDALEQVTLSVRVKYRVLWDQGVVHLHGPRVRDVLAAAGVDGKDGVSLFVRGKPYIYRDPKKPVHVPMDKIRDCDVILATRIGVDKRPIPTRLGGPVTLAFPDDCPDDNWLTFVEHLEVVGK